MIVDIWITGIVLQGVSSRKSLAGVNIMENGGRFILDDFHIRSRKCVANQNGVE
jgi:hypothetical protein